MFNPFKKAPSLDAFASIEDELRGARPKPRPEFKAALQAQLRARHQALREEALEQASKPSLWNWFSTHTLATTSLLMLFVVGGGLVVFNTEEESMIASEISEDVEESDSMETTVALDVESSDESSEESFTEGRDDKLPDSIGGGGLDSSISLADSGEQNSYPSIAPVKIRFPKPMNQASVEAAFSIDPITRGRFLWESPKVLYFLPYNRFNPEADYKVTVSGDAQFASEEALEIPYEISFRPVTLSAEDAQDFSTLGELRVKSELTDEDKWLLFDLFDLLVRWNETAEGGTSDTSADPFQGGSVNLLQIP